MKKVVIAISVLVVLGALSGSVFADSIDFNGNSAGNSGTWTFSSSTLTATYNSSLNTAANITSGTSHTSVGTISFTSGGLTGGAGTIGNPYTFASGGSLSVSNATSGVCTGLNISGCFTGSFVDAQIVTNGTSSFTFSANFIDGTVNTGLLTALGIPTNITGANGVLSATLSGTFPGDTGSKTGSADLTVTPVPEPATLGLLGAGLLGLGLLGLSHKKRSEA